MAKQRITPTQVVNNPVFYGYRQNGASSVIIGPTRFIASMAHINVGNCYDTSTGIYTCPKAGNYLVVFDSFTDTSSPAGPVYLRKNGANIARQYMSGGRYEPIGINGILSCAVGDTIDIYVGTVTELSRLHGNESSSLSIMYVGT